MYWKAGASILGWVGGHDPQILGRGLWGSWTGHDILLYLIMYRKYILKWRFLKRNGIICPEVIVNGQFFKLREKIEIFWKSAWKTRNLFVKLPEKLKFLGNFFDPDSRPLDFKSD